MGKENLIKRVLPWISGAGEISGSTGRVMKSHTAINPGIDRSMRSSALRDLHRPQGSDPLMRTGKTETIRHVEYLTQPSIPTDKTMMRHQMTDFGSPYRGAKASAAVLDAITGMQIGGKSYGMGAGTVKMPPSLAPIRPPLGTSHVGTPPTIGRPRPSLGSQKPGPGLGSYMGRGITGGGMLANAALGAGIGAGSSYVTGGNIGQGALIGSAMGAGASFGGAMMRRGAARYARGSAGSTMSKGYSSGFTSNMIRATSGLETAGGRASMWMGGAFLGGSAFGGNRHKRKGFNSSRGNTFGR